MGKSLLIIESSEIIRKGLIKVIESYGLFNSITELACSSGIEASVIKHEPDVILINPGMLKPDLTEWFNGYRNGEVKIAAIVYALFDEEYKDLFDEEIQVGDTRLKIKKKLDRLLTPGDSVISKPADDTLSVREKDVVKLLAKGLSNKEISEKLFISPHTVITHRKNITRKLNIKSVAGLIVYAIINGIVDVDDLHEDKSL